MEHSEFKISISVESYDEKTTENYQNCCVAEKRIMIYQAIAAAIADPTLERSSAAAEDLYNLQSSWPFLVIFFYIVPIHRYLFLLLPSI